MAARILDGKALAAKIRLELKAGAEAFKIKKGRQPGLAVVLVGDDPASQTYVNNKHKACQENGFYSEVHRLPAAATEEELLKLVRSLNAKAELDGILVQMPLPKHLDAEEVILAISPDKDVDGLHPLNAGRLSEGMPGLVPCTPVGCMELLKGTGVPLKGLHAVVVGRSNLVGKPVAQLLLAQHCTVTLCHSRTLDLPAVVRLGDVVVAAVGKAGMITGDMIKPGAIVLDVGTSRKADGKLAGDVDFKPAAEKAAWITPVPGGVGPMTITMLLKNTLLAAEAFSGTH
jgi:methylenetetrahydrofolate dehydrogenase (NADP+)/methenyltetrahydrofolate cyclohydrolase